MPKMLKRARPAALPYISGYSSTPASWVKRSTADGSRRANLSTAAS
jgi:hypothetical protein